MQLFGNIYTKCVIPKTNLSTLMCLTHWLTYALTDMPELTITWPFWNQPTDCSFLTSNFLVNSVPALLLIKKFPDLQKLSRTPENVFLGLCHNPVMFKYKDKQQLLNIYRVWHDNPSQAVITNWKETVWLATCVFQGHSLNGELITDNIWILGQKSLQKTSATEIVLIINNGKTSVYCTISLQWHSNLIISSNCKNHLLH